MSKRSPTIVGACIGAAATIIAAIIVVVFTNVFSKSDKSTSVHESTEVSPDSVRALGEPVGGTATQPDESIEQIVSTPDVLESTEVSPDSVQTSGEPVGGTTIQPDESIEQTVSTPEYFEAIKDESFSPVTLDQFYETHYNDSLTELQKEDFVKKQLNRRLIWEG